MYHHQTWEDKFSFHELKQEDSLLRVVPARGGIITEWVVDGQPVLYLDRETLMDTSQNIRGGIPILFPICGPLQDGQYRWENNHYRMKQHGLARNLPWKVTQVEVGDREASLTLETAGNPDTRLAFPFDFRLVFSYILKADSLTIKQRYLNKSDTDMPFYAGFHPYFYAPDRRAVRLNIPAATGSCRNLLTRTVEPFSGVLNLEGKAEANYVLDRLTGNRVSFGNLGTGREVVLEFAGEFKYIVLWALEGKDFVCVEPWMADNYALNTGKGLHKLGPGEQLETWVSLTVRPE
ncbi:MAG: aldose epimerase [Clostridia bacterium]|nr:aldose epimerase [Clostridia bacterium]